jgi:hypothetical protein
VLIESPERRVHCFSVRHVHLGSLTHSCFNTEIQVRRLALMGQEPYLPKLKHLSPEGLHRRLPGITLTAASSPIQTGKRGYSRHVKALLRFQVKRVRRNGGASDLIIQILQDPFFQNRNRDHLIYTCELYNQMLYQLSYGRNDTFLRRVCLLHGHREHSAPAFLCLRGWVGWGERHYEAASPSKHRRHVFPQICVRVLR